MSVKIKPKFVKKNARTLLSVSKLMDLSNIPQNGYDLRHRDSGMIRHWTGEIEMAYIFSVSHKHRQS